MDFHGTFSCGGKVNPNDWQLSKKSFLSQGELNNVFFPGDSYCLSLLSKVWLFNCELPGSAAIMRLSHFANCTEMQLKILNRSESFSRIDLATKDENSTDLYERRKSISDFICYVRTYLLRLDQQSNESIESVAELDHDLDVVSMALRRFFARFRGIPESTFHYAASNLGNKCSQPEFHMYHTHLELRWLFLTVVYVRAISIRSSDIDYQNFDNTLRLIIDDLIYISIKIFERINFADLRTKTPYSCTCVREFWLMIQIFLENAAERTKSKTFWEYVNRSLRTILEGTADRTDERKIFWHRVNEKEPLPLLRPSSKNPELFAAWLIYNLALLHGYNSDGIYVGGNTSTRVLPNYEGIDDILKGFVRRGGKDGDRDEIDEELRIIIPFVRVLFEEWWETRVQIITYLWDCFHRRLDQPFLLQSSSGPWAVSIEKKSPADILKQVRDRIDGNLDPGKESSYGMFLRFLGAFLKKTYDKIDSRQWNQIKGRIYSKFSKNKVHEFGEPGLYNFVSLFLTLAITADTTNACTVMLGFLPPVLPEDSNKHEKRLGLSWKAQLAVLLLYNENSINLAGISGNFTKVVNCISCLKDENSRSMMASFIDVLASTIKSSERFENGEHLLMMSGWIDRYILECPKNRVGALIKILVEIFEKCAILEDSRNDSGVDKMLDALWSSVASRVRQLFFMPAISGDSYADIARLAVAFTLDGLKNPTTAARYKHTAASLFQHFTSSAIVKDVRMTKAYLATILQNDRALEDLKSQINNFDLIIIQAWIKCCILGQDRTHDPDMRLLKNRFSIIPEIQRLLSNEADAIDFERSEEPLLVFFTVLAKIRNLSATEQERHRLEARVRSYFGNIEKWALIPIGEVETSGRESDLAHWIYRCIGTLILSCSSILYVKNQPNNLLRILINTFVLPAEQSQQKRLKHLAKRIFSMILLGVEKLNARTDLSLQALIRDLFEAYLPLLVTEDVTNFNISESLLRFFATATIDFAQLIFEKLASCFLIASGDNATHKHCYLVMLILRNLAKSGETYESHIIELVVAVCLPNIVSCYFKVHNLHPHRRHTVDIIEDIAGNPYYTGDQSLRNKLLNTIFAVIVKFLTFNSQCVLDFLHSIVKTNPGIVASLLPRIECMLADFEKSNRPNVASLRYSLNQLRSTIKQNCPKL